MSQATNTDCLSPVCHSHDNASQYKLLRGLCFCHVHDSLKLINIDVAVPVEIKLLNHAEQILVINLLSQLIGNHFQVLRTDSACALSVKQPECV